MHSTILPVGIFFASALAIPHFHHSKHHDHPFPTRLLTASAPSGTGIAANTTGILRFHPLSAGGDNGHELEDNLEGLNVPKTNEAAPSALLPIQDKHNLGPNAPACDAATVTVTADSTVTVTVGGSGASAETGSSDSVANKVNKSPQPVGPAKGQDIKANSAPAASSSASASPSTSNTESSASGNEDTAEAPAAPSASKAPTSSSNTFSPEPAGSNDTPAASSSSPASPASSGTSDTSSGSTDTGNTTSTGSTGASQGGLPFKTKRGIIASGDSAEALAGAFGDSKLSWLGNWYSGPPHSITPNLQFVPQNYGKQSDIKGEWTKNAQQAVDKGAKYMLSFGEPGTPNDKLHMEPAEAVQLWKDKMEPYAKQGVTIGAPGTLQNTQDFDWLNKFIDACTGCSIGFVALHWFDKAMSKNVAGFKETCGKAKAVADKIGKPVWLDNFSAEGDAAAQKEFLGEVVPWLEEQEYIVAYAYVPPEVGKAGAGGNMVDGGKLNELGQFYANL